MKRTHVASAVSFLSLFLISFNICLSSSSSSSTDSVVYGGCSQLKYAPGSSYQSSVDSLLTSLITSSAVSPYNNFTVPGQDSGPLYGLYQCRGDISTADCSTCIQAAVSQIGVLCSSSYGGAIQLRDCFVKYDNASFLGAPDKTMVAKKCGAVTSSYGTDLLSQRDEVLTELGTGSGQFRVGTVGYVSGMAQCVGDLSAAGCSECISEATERLCGECGQSVSGDVYLGKCYVGCTATGDNAKSGNKNSEDEARNTLVIIVGVLVGVALLIIVVLYFKGKPAMAADDIVPILSFMGKATAAFASAAAVEASTSAAAAKASAESSAKAAAAESSAKAAAAEASKKAAAAEGSAKAAAAEASKAVEASKAAAKEGNVKVSNKEESEEG